jgi:acyl-CoA synthetase (AMP-forming)/AMP-acid ligase II
MPTVEIANLVDVVRVHGAERSDAVALHVGDDSITFAQLDERSSRAAQAFKAAGVGFGDRVAFIEKNGAEYFDVSFGLAKLGAVCVAVNWRLAPPEMLQIIDDSHHNIKVAAVLRYPARPAKPNAEGVLCREVGGPGVNLSITTDDLCLDRHGGRVERAHPTPHLKVHPQHRTVGQPIMPSAHCCAHWPVPSVSLRPR